MSMGKKKKENRLGGKITPNAFLKQKKQNITNILSSPMEHQFQILLIFTLCRHWNNKP